MAKKPKKTTRPSNVYKFFEGAKSKNKSCPKCGAGVYMAKHKNRDSCGKCGFTEFNK